MTGTVEVNFDDLKALAKEKLGDGFVVYYGDDGGGGGGYTVMETATLYSRWLGATPKAALPRLEAYITAINEE